MESLAVSLVFWGSREQKMREKTEAALTRCLLPVYHWLPERVSLLVATGLRPGYQWCISQFVLSWKIVFFFFSYTYFGNICTFRYSDAELTRLFTKAWYEIPRTASFNLGIGTPIGLQSLSYGVMATCGLKRWMTRGDPGGRGQRLGPHLPQEPPPPRRLYCVAASGRFCEQLPWRRNELVLWPNPKTPFTCLLPSSTPALPPGTTYPPPTMSTVAVSLKGGF